MKEFGIKIYTIIEENFIMQVAIFMKENLLEIWLRVLEFISTLMEVNTLVIGIKTNKMDSVKNNGVTAVSTKVITKMHPKKVKANTFGLMGILT